MALIYFRCGANVSSFIIHSQSSSDYPQTHSSTSYYGYTGFASSSTDCWISDVVSTGGTIHITDGSSTWDYSSDPYISTTTSGRYITVYADAPTYTCSYYANGGTWSSGSNPYVQTIDSAGYYYTSTPSGLVSRSGYTLLGWSASSSATTATYSTNEAIGPTSANLVLYAVWESSSVTITLYGNGGIWGRGTSSQTAYVYVSKSTGDVLSFGNYKNDFTYPNYTHKGWYANGSTPAATYGVDGYVTVGGTNAQYDAYWEWSRFYFYGVSKANDETYICTNALTTTLTASAWNSFQDSISGFATLTGTSGVTEHDVVAGTPMYASQYNETLAEIKKIKTKIGSSRSAPATVSSGSTAYALQINNLRDFFNGLIDDYYA